jgi:predicted metalloenzyme YecM
MVLNSAISNVLIKFFLELLDNFIISFKGSFQVWDAETATNWSSGVSQCGSIVYSSNIEDTILVVITLSCKGSWELAVNGFFLDSLGALLDAHAISEHVRN